MILLQKELPFVTLTPHSSAPRIRCRYSTSRSVISGQCSELRGLLGLKSIRLRHGMNSMHGVLFGGYFVISLLCKKISF